MFKPLRLIFGTTQIPAPDSSDISTSDIDVQVGRSIDAQTIHIPHSVLRSCPALSTLLTPGCRISNADPVIFAIIIEHLECSSILGTFRFNVPGHLQELISGKGALLNFAKAWHVGNMLEMHGLQNKLLEIYRVHYLQCLKDHVHLPVDPEPFTYLRDNIGNHTMAERFLVDFHAGLMQTESRFEPKDLGLLPNDIVINMRDRWKELSGQVRKDSLLSELRSDRIAAGSSNYKVSKDDATLHSAMQVQHLCIRPGPTQFVLTPSTHSQRRTASKLPVCSTPSSTDSYSTSRPRMGERQPSHHTSNTEAPTHQTPPASQTPVAKPIITNPFLEPSHHKRPRTPSRPLSPTEQPSTLQPLAQDYRLSTGTINGFQSPHQQESKTSPTSGLPKRAPFMPAIPARAPQPHEIEESEITDEESVYDLFAPEIA
ncbi:hypothetical protein EKO04_007246 [Ascochyta lentis]|uniref:BTB domain-containing protein n=1 Tax=Ascochyta lentis TaxID=205686 RepID=A0A8H7J105_9PLEO|nr:hypothetical protein EKO04_007246 [Ascochyta lentis]